MVKKDNFIEYARNNKGIVKTHINRIYGIIYNINIVNIDKSYINSNNEISSNETQTNYIYDTTDIQDELIFNKIGTTSTISISDNTKKKYLI